MEKSDGDILRALSGLVRREEGKRRSAKNATGVFYKEEKKRRREEDGNSNG